MNATETFRAKAPRLMAQLAQDFMLSTTPCAAAAGNGGHESAGFTLLQEIRPTVKGSRGGFGWFQWTGPRRRAFEAYCQRNGLDPASDKANYAWLFLELKSTEKRTIAKLKAASPGATLRDLVVLFEQSYLRAGVKHYDSRLTWAKLALDAAIASGVPAEAPILTPDEARAAAADEAAASKKRATNQGLGAGGLTAGTGGTATADPSMLADWLMLGLGAVLVAGVVWLVVAALRNRSRAADLNQVAKGDA